MHKFFVIMTFWVLCSSSVHAAGFFDNLKEGFANAFDVSKSRLEAYRQSTDKDLLNQFYALSEDGKQQGLSKELLASGARFEVMKVSSSMLTLRQRFYREGNMMSIVQAMRGYNYGALDDAVAKRYVAFAAERGNVVKLYKPAMGGLLNAALAQNFQLQHDRNTAEWFNLDNALVEFSPDKRVISVLTRAHQAVVNLGANSYQYVNIYFGPGNGRFIENKFSNADWDNQFIRVISGETVTQSGAMLPAGSAETVMPLTATPIQPLVTGQREGALGAMEQRIKLLKNLSDLKNSGALNEAEFDVEKKKILAQ